MAPRSKEDGLTNAPSRQAFLVMLLPGKKMRGKTLDVSPNCKREITRSGQRWLTRGFSKGNAFASFHLPSSIFHLPSSIFHLPSSIFHLPSSMATVWPCNKKRDSKSGRLQVPSFSQLAYSSSSSITRQSSSESNKMFPQCGHVNWTPVRSNRSEL